MEAPCCSSLQLPEGSVGTSEDLQGPKFDAQLVVLVGGGLVLLCVLVHPVDGVPFGRLHLVPDLRARHSCMANLKTAADQVQCGQQNNVQ